jgi:hypothetical protein
LPNPTVCPIRSLTQIDHECSGIFNAKPTGADQPLRFKRYLLLRFIQKKLHPNPTQMFEQLQCQDHQTSSVIPVSASPPDHIEPILTEAPSPYLLYLHSRTLTGEIPSRERNKRNLFQTTIFTHPFAILATDRGRRVIKSPSGTEIDKEK